MHQNISDADYAESNVDVIRQKIELRGVRHHNVAHIPGYFQRTLPVIAGKTGKGGDYGHLTAIGIHYDAVRGGSCTDHQRAGDGLGIQLEFENRPEQRQYGSSLQVAGIAHEAIIFPPDAYLQQPENDLYNPHRNQRGFAQQYADMMAPELGDDKRQKNKQYHSITFLDVSDICVTNYY